MTVVNVGTIDVFVIAPEPAGWAVLALQRSLTTRCPSAWETVHGRIEPDERPEEAAVREVREETGLACARLYNLMVQPFYLHKLSRVELAVVFVAFVDRDQPIVLGEEHMRHEWLTPEQALERFVWPRERSGLRDAMQLLRTGDAGPVEDVLRVY